jgi:hypothetical protein
MKHRSPEDKSIGMLEYWNNGMLGKIQELRNYGI